MHVAHEDFSIWGTECGAVILLLEFVHQGPFEHSRANALRMNQHAHMLLLVGAWMLISPL